MQRCFFISIINSKIIKPNVSLYLHPLFPKPHPYILHVKGQEYSWQSSRILMAKFKKTRGKALEDSWRFEKTNLLKKMT